MGLLLPLIGCGLPLLFIENVKGQAFAYFVSDN
jgi:hypothetical protein